METTTKNGWSETLVMEVADVNALTVNKSYPHSEIEYVDINSVSGGRIGKTQKLKLKEAPSRAKRIVRDNDVLISTVRPNLKHFCFIRSASPNLIASTGFAVISADLKKADPYFLYSLLTTTSYTEKLSRIAEGHTSAYPSFNPEVIEKSSFPLPSLPEQREIASVLFSLDNKIELLRGQNETLEQIARTVFNEWFTVDDTGEMAHLSDFIDHIREQVLPAKTPTDIFSHYSIPAFDAGKTPVREAGTAILSNKYRVQEGVILFSKLNPETPRVWLIFTPFTNSICSTEFQVLKPKKKSLLPFVYSVLRFSEYARQLASMVQGTSSSHQRLRPEDILSIEFPRPRDEMVNTYNELAYPILKKVEDNENQMRALADIRDLLLPRLMSGDVRIHI